MHPEDTTSTKENVTIVTLENVLLNQPYNDLGFIVGNRLMIFVEAQSTWSENIVVRSLLYMSQTIQEYIMETNQNVYSSKRIYLPKPELYVLFTGERKTLPSHISLSETFFGGESCDLDVTVNMIYDGKQGDIINQYVTFLKVYHEQVKLYKRTQKAVLETIRICKDENVLREYLMSREKEVVDIMMLLYNREYIFDSFVNEEKEIAREEGRAEERAKALADAENRSKETARSLHGMGLPVEKIAAAINYSVETVKQWLNIPSQEQFPNG